MLLLIGTNKLTLIATAATVLGSFGFVEFFGRIGNAPEGLAIIAFLRTLVVIAPIALLFSVAFAITKSLRTSSKSLQLESVLLSYLCVLVSFAAFYYYLAAYSDLNDSVSEYNYYEMLNHPIYSGRDSEQDFTARRPSVPLEECHSGYGMGFAINLSHGPPMLATRPLTN